MCAWTYISPLLGEHPRIVNIVLGPVTVHYREVSLYSKSRKKYNSAILCKCSPWGCKNHFWHKKFASLHIIVDYKCWNVIIYWVHLFQFSPLHAFKEGLYRIQILCRRYQFWSYPAGDLAPRRFNNSWPAGLTKAEVSPSLFTQLSPSLFPPHQILYRASLNGHTLRETIRRTSACRRDNAIQTNLFQLSYMSVIIIHWTFKMKRRKSWKGYVRS